MVSSLEMMPWLLAILCLAIARCANITDQQTSESQSDQQVAILKQIRKVNEDGSYTYGYEAGDGSFKVESRDVLGNIKGTFGFVDATGEIKRVSYSSSNGTGFKSTSVSPLQEQISMVQSRNNRTVTTKKPTTLYTSSTESSSPKTSVVQPIPRTRKPPIISTTPMSESSNENFPRPGFVRSKGRHRFIINGQQRPVILEEEEVAEEDLPITRITNRDKDTTIRKVIFTKRPLEQSLPPITEEFEDKVGEVKIASGNLLRRQLKEETTKATPVVENEDDHADVYGGALSTSRPLFTTTNPPRVIPRISDIRGERQKQVYVNQDSGPAKFEQGSRMYEQQETKMHSQEDRNPAQQVLIRTTTRAPGDPREYIRQPIEPIYVRQQANAYLRELPPGGILIPAPENTLEEDPRLQDPRLQDPRLQDPRLQDPRLLDPRLQDPRLQDPRLQDPRLQDPRLRGVPLSRLLFRQDFGRFLPPQQPLYSGGGDPNVHYLTDSPPGAQEQEGAAPRIPVNPTYVARQRTAYQRQLAYPPEDVADPRRPVLRPIPLSPAQQDEREYQNVAAEYSYRSPLALPPEPPNPIAPPLSRRDFQLLLRRLLVSQYGIQALNYPRTYLEDALYDQQPYPTYQPAYQTAIPREGAYAAESVAPVAPMIPPVPPVAAAAGQPPYPERIPLRRATMYPRAINPLYQQDEYTEGRYPKRVYRQKFYSNEVADDGEEILPPHIREALLLRMLQLAINAERPLVMPNSMIMTTTSNPTAVRYRKSGPVRNVQILGEDAEEEKETKKKM